MSDPGNRQIDVEMARGDAKVRQVDFHFVGISSFHVVEIVSISHALRFSSRPRSILVKGIQKDLHKEEEEEEHDVVRRSTMVPK